jgi:small subunit ribosomal protein S14
MSGRPRGFESYFGLSRIALRDMALAGLLPGVRKASW